MALKDFLLGLRGKLPTADELQRVRWLRPVAHRLADPALWRSRPEPLARGVAIGLFWAFAVPFAQIVLAAAHCVWWRANIPVAAAITFITNPFTVGFWLLLAYHVGSLFLPGRPPPSFNGDDLLGTLEAFGWPTLLGMALFAVGGAAAGYFAVRGGAWLWFHRRFAKRRARNPRPR
jgi:hypothetical protein